MISFYKLGKGKLLACEDSLTASIFDPLKYLPSDLFWYILKKAALKDNLPALSGPILSITFWDKWNSEGTSNSNFVEPDVFIRFKEFDLIIEAKRYDLNQQYDEQIGNEIIAYNNEYGEDEKALFFIQLGGVNIDDEKDNFSIKIDNYEKFVKTTKITWTGISNAVFEIKVKMESQDFPGQDSQVLILSDVIESLEIHGFFKKSWLSDMDCPTINLNYFKNHQLNFYKSARIT